MFPSFCGTPSGADVLIGTRHEFRCCARGVPTPVYEWQREVGGARVPVVLDDRVREVNSSMSSMLVIEPTRREDAGDYICVAINEHGNLSSSSVELRIRGKVWPVAFACLYVAAPSPSSQPLPSHLSPCSWCQLAPAGWSWAGNPLLMCTPPSWSTGWSTDCRLFWAFGGL